MLSPIDKKDFLGMSPRQVTQESESSEDRFEDIYRLLADALKYIREKSKTDSSSCFGIGALQSEYEKIACEIRILGNANHTQLEQLSLRIDKLSKRTLVLPECNSPLSKIYSDLRSLYCNQLAIIGANSQMTSVQKDSFSSFAEEAAKNGKANFLGLLRDPKDKDLCKRFGGLRDKLYPILNDRLREVFCKKLMEIKALNNQDSRCFICYNIDEPDVISWIQNVLGPDMWRIGVEPVWSRSRCAAGAPLGEFMLRAGTEDFATVICTPALFDKCGWESGVAIEIKDMKDNRLQNKIGTTIPILFKKRSGGDPQDVNPFRDMGAKGPFAVVATLENYTGILNFLVTLKLPNKEDCREIGEKYIAEVKSEGVEILEELLRLQEQCPEHSFFHPDGSRTNSVPTVETEQRQLETIVRLIGLHQRLNRSRGFSGLQKIEDEQQNWKCVVGNIRLNKNDLIAVKTAFEKIHEINKSHELIDKRPGRDHTRREIFAMQIESQIYYELGEYQDAISVYYKMLALDPNIYLAHRNLGRIYTILGEVQKAEDRFLWAMCIPGAGEDAIVEYGMLLLRLGRYKEAIDQLSKVKRGDVELIYRFADSNSLYEELNGELEDQKLIRIRADHLACFLLAKAHLKTGDMQRTRESCDIFRSLLQIHRSPLGNKLLGHLYAELEEWSKAQEAFGF